MPERKKFVLGDTEDFKELETLIKKDDPKPQNFRVRRNMEIRIRNHLFEQRKNDEIIDQHRNQIRKINSSFISSLAQEAEAIIELDRLGAEIKNLTKWQRHLRADIKFLNRQKDLLNDGKGFKDRGIDKR